MYVRLSLDLSWQARHVPRPCTPAHARGSAHPCLPLCFPSIRHGTPCRQPRCCMPLAVRHAWTPQVPSLQSLPGLACAQPCHWALRPYGPGDRTLTPSSVNRPSSLLSSSIFPIAQAALAADGRSPRRAPSGRCELQLSRAALIPRSSAMSVSPICPVAATSHPELTSPCPNPPPHTAW